MRKDNFCWTFGTMDKRMVFLSKIPKWIVDQIGSVMEPTTAAMAAAYGYNYFHDQNEVRYLVWSQIPT